MPITTGPGTLHIDGQSFDVSSVTFVRNKYAQPTERWCRYCGGRANEDAWRMSCDPCWQTYHPTTVKVNELYMQWQYRWPIDTSKELFTQIASTA